MNFIRISTSSNFSGDAAAPPGVLGVLVVEEARVVDDLAGRAEDALHLGLHAGGGREGLGG